MKRLKLMMVMLGLPGIFLTVIYYMRFQTGGYCHESPVIRWKFAIYSGECDDETGCHFLKMDHTGMAEYFGIKEIPCLEFHKQLTIASSNDSSVYTSTRKAKTSYTDFKKEINIYRRKPGISTSDYLYNLLSNDIYFYWQGTPWDFNGTTREPGKGYIACGYFVTNTLSDLGFTIQRVKLAQAASSDMIKQLCVAINRLGDFEKLQTYLDKQPNNSVFIIGLDFHTGYVLKDATGSYFLHSNYISREGVIKEKTRLSKALKSSKSFMIGNLTANKRLLDQWSGN